MGISTASSFMSTLATLWRRYYRFHILGLTCFPLCFDLVVVRFLPHPCLARFTFFLSATHTPRSGQATSANTHPLRSSNHPDPACNISIRSRDCLTARSENALLSHSISCSNPGCPRHADLRNCSHDLNSVVSRESLLACPAWALRPS